MEKILRFFLITSALFAFLMAILGIRNLFVAGAQPAVFGIGIIGIAALAAALIGWRKENTFWAAGGALGAGIIFPTQWGIIPMVAGFLIFISLISLQLYCDNMRK